MKKQNTLRVRILCGLIGLYLSLAFLFAQVFVSMQGYFLHGDTLQNRLCREESVSLVQEYLLSEGHFIADACGLPYSVFDGVFSESEIRFEETHVLSSALAQTEYTVDVSALRERLERSVRRTLSDLEETEDLSAYDAEIAGFCDQIVKLYADTLQLRLYGYLAPLRNTVQTVLLYAGIVVAAVFALSVFCLVWLLRDLYTVLRECAYACFASGLFSALLALVLRWSRLLSRISISPEFMRTALRAYVEDGCAYMSVVGFGTAACGVVLFAVSAIPFLRKKRTGQREESE